MTTRSRGAAATTAQDQSLARAVVARGWVAADQMRRLISASGEGHTLAQTLISRGLLSVDQLSQALLEISSRGGLPQVGRYQLLRELGRGGAGVVYEGYDPQARRRVAIKVLRRAGERAAQRLLREGQLLARLQHPHVIEVYEVAEATIGDDPQARPFIAMEYISGRSLQAALPALDEEARLRFFGQLVDGVAHAHEAGIIHRDLKPANVMIEGDRRAVLMDFGLGAAENLSQLTETGAAMGTVTHMAPEQVEGKRAKMGPPTDVWALGVILYEMLTGSLPFWAKTPVGIYAQILREDPEPPRARAADIPPELEAICLKALSRDPAQRYPSASELAADLARQRAGKRVTAPGVRRANPLLRWVRRHPLLAGAAATVALAVLVVAVVSSVAYLQVQRALEASRQAQQAELGARQLAEQERARATDQAAQARQASLAAERSRALARRRLLAALTAQGDALAAAHPAQARRRYGEAARLERELDGDSWLSRLAAATLTRRAPRPLRRISLGGLRPHTLRTLDRRRAIAIGERAGALIDLIGGRVLRRFELHPGASCAAVHPSALVVTGHRDGTIWVHDLAPAAGPALRLIAGDVPILTVAIAPDASRVLAGQSVYGVGERRADAPDAHRRYTNVFVIGLPDRARRRPTQMTLLQGHWGSISAVAFSADGRLALSAAGDGTAREWQLADGKLLATHAGLSGAPRAVADRSEQLLTAGDDGTLRLHDRREQRLLHQLQAAGPETDGALRGAIGCGRERVLVWSERGPARLVDFSGRRLLDLQAGAEPPTAAAVIGPDSALTAEADELLLWSLSPATLAGRHDDVVADASSADGRLLATAHEGGQLRLWDLDWRVPLATLATGLSPRCLALDAAGERALVGGDRGLELWDLRGGRRLAQLPGGPVSQLALAPDGARALVATDDEIRLLALSDHQRPLARWPRPAGARLALRFDAAGAAWLRLGQRLRHLDAGGGEAASWTLPTADGPLASMRAGGVAALAHGDDGAALWRSRDRSTLRLSDAPRAPLLETFAAPSGRWLAVIEVGGALTVLDAGSGAVAHRADLGRDLRRVRLSGTRVLVWRRRGLEILELADAPQTGGPLGLVRRLTLAGQAETAVELHERAAPESDPLADAVARWRAGAAVDLEALRALLREARRGPSAALASRWLGGLPASADGARLLRWARAPATIGRLHATFGGGALTGNQDARLALLDEQLQPRRQALPASEAPLAVDASRRFVACYRDHALHIIDTQSQEQRRPDAQLHRQYSGFRVRGALRHSSATFVRGRHRLVTGRAGALTSWDFGGTLMHSSNTQQARVTPARTPVPAAALSALRQAAPDADAEPVARVDALASSPDGLQLVAAIHLGAPDSPRPLPASHGYLQLFNEPDSAGRLQAGAGLLAHAAPITALVWAEDGRLLTAAADGSLRSWRLRDGRLQPIAKADAPAPATALAVAPDGRLASAHSDGTLRVWRGLAQPPLTLRMLGPLRGVSWLPGDKLLATSQDGAAALWQLTP